jgi:hypothetical protein
MEARSAISRQQPPSTQTEIDGSVMNVILRKSRAQALIEGLNPDIWGEDDYAVIDGEACVGCVYPELIHGETKWRWFLLILPPNNGITNSLDEAKTVIKERYDQVRAKSEQCGRL